MIDLLPFITSRTTLSLVRVAVVPVVETTPPLVDEVIVDVFVEEPELVPEVRSPPVVMLGLMVDVVEVRSYSPVVPVPVVALGPEPPDVEPSCDVVYPSPEVLSGAPVV
jgi:hypothetical protein